MCCGLLKLKTFHCVGERGFRWEGKLSKSLWGVEFLMGVSATLVYIHVTCRNDYPCICCIFQMKTQPSILLGWVRSAVLHRTKHILKLISMMGRKMQIGTLDHMSFWKTGIYNKIVFSWLDADLSYLFKCFLSDMVPESTIISTSTVLFIRKQACASHFMVKKAQKNSNENIPFLHAIDALNPSLLWRGGGL